MTKLHIAMAIAMMGFAVCLGLGSIVGFILGLVYRRKWAWISSLLGFLLASALFAGGLALGVFTAISFAEHHGGQALVQMMAEPDDRNVIGCDSNMRRWFEDGTGFELPVDAEFVAGKDFGARTCAVYMKLQAPLGFQAQLDANLKRADAMPGELKARFSYEIDIVEEMPWWVREVSAPGLVYYVGKPDATDSEWTTAIAFDPATGMLWFAGTESDPHAR